MSLLSSLRFWLDLISQPQARLRGDRWSKSSASRHIYTARDRVTDGRDKREMPLHRTMLALLFAASAAFAPTPRTQRHTTRRHLNFGNFGGNKKVDEDDSVKEAETVDVVGAHGEVVQNCHM